MIYFLENGEKLKTKEIDYFKVICDECGSETKLKNYPTGSKITYLCNVCGNSGNRNPMYGKKWTDELRKLRSEKYKGKNNPMYNRSIYDVWLEKYGKVIADEKMAIHAKNASNNSIGCKNGMYGKTFYQQWVKLYGEKIVNLKLEISNKKKSDWLKNNHEQLKKMIINSHKKPYRKTEIEKTIEKFLLENNIKHKYNFLLDKYQYDFLLYDYNTIIEIKGDYWHAKPL